MTPDKSDSSDNVVPHAKCVAINPVDLALVALHLADRSNLPCSIAARQMFPQALQLLTDAAKFITDSKGPPRLEHLSHEEAAQAMPASRVLIVEPAEKGKAVVISDRGTEGGFSFAEAIKGESAPLGQIWKSRQALEQGIKRLSTNGQLKGGDIERWLRERKLSAMDLDLIARAVKVERCGKLDENDPTLTLPKLIETIPKRARRQSS